MCWVRGVGCGVRDVGCEVWGAGCGVRGVGCRMWGAGCGVRGVGAGCGVRGVGVGCEVWLWYMYVSCYIGVYIPVEIAVLPFCILVRVHAGTVLCLVNQI